MNEAQKYSKTEFSSMGQIEMESCAFIKAAAMLNSIKEHWDTERVHLHDALDKNKLLWSFVACAMKEKNCPQPPAIRKQILNLALFVFKHTLSILSNPKPESLTVLININMNIGKGLAGSEKPEVGNPS